MICGLRYFFIIPAVILMMGEAVVAQNRVAIEREGLEIAALFQKITRDTHWQQTSAELLDFTTYHTQGMTKVKDTFYLSTVEILVRTEHMEEGEPYDRTAGEGVGHLFTFDESGKKIKSVTLGEGDMYHPGGIDYDGEYIWVPVAEYRPNSSSIIYKVHPGTLEAVEVFRVSDHIGAVIRNPDQNIVYGFSWGSRRIYSWQLNDSLHLKNPEDAAARSFVHNTQHYIDYQDCQYTGGDVMICSGLSHYNTGRDGPRFALGGLELIELHSLTPVHQIPIELYTTGDVPRVMTQNPFYVEQVGRGLRFYFIPEDDASHFYIYDVEIP